MNPESESQEQPQVILVKRIAAPAKRLFEAWLDPHALGVFMCPAPGMSVTKTEVDPRVGGAFLVMMKTGDKEMPHTGQYTEIVPHLRLAFTWRSEHAGEHNRVLLSFDAVAEDVTVLKLEHYGLPSSALSAHHGGWSQILTCLEAIPLSPK